MSRVEKLRDRARTAEARDPRSAIDAWLDVLKAQDDESDPNPDLSIYNRIGDLYLKIKDPGQAADYYEQGVDRYAELGFHNNAIALCNKVLRNAPGRPTTYLKLAKLYAAKGFLSEARQNFVEYAERMKRAGQIDRAFAALKQVTDLSPESESLRHMLEEHLRTYGEVKGRPTRASTADPAPAPAEPKHPKRKTSSLVFLDVDEPAPGRSAPVPTARAGGSPPAAAPPAPPAPKAEPRTPEPRKAGRDLEFVSGRDARRGAEPPALEVERTAVGEDTEAPTGGVIEGLELTSTDFHEVRRSLTNIPRIREEDIADAPVSSIGGFEPTIDESPAIAEPPAAPPPPPAPRAAPPPSRAAPPSPEPAPTPSRAAPPAPAPAPSRAAPPPEPAPPPSRAAPRPPEPALAPPPEPAPPPAPPPSRAAPPPPPPAPPSPPARERTPIEVPPLEMEPEFQSATGGGHAIDDDPLVVDHEDEPLSTWIQRAEDLPTTPLGGGRSQGFIDLGVEGVTTGDSWTPGARVPGGIEMPSIDDLEARVADDPDDAGAHRSLGEALIEAGDRERGIEELDLAATGYDSAGNIQQAQDLLNEILRLDPNSVRHRQRAVEYAFRAGDHDQLIEAYLELADALLRNNLPDKAQAVYERVAEHDPHNARAQAALSMLTAAPPAAEGRVPPEAARMRVRDETSEDGDYIDLSALVLDETADPIRDTRMKVEDEAPTGDEERDFQEMLARFKQGIDENIDETDFQSHYDLGVAFKEMGLLDEAISEFQRALRAPEGKLRTTEALGVCFYEKGALGVAESILRRGLELPAGGDQERLGVLYWLARALEGQSRRAEARDYYGRVFAVDIRFMDVGERVRAMSR